MAVAPTVSVIIPAYNVAPYIGETLDSLLAQSFTDYEVLLINDGSTDQTEQVVLSYRAKFGDRLTYECQSNRGIAGARNAGLFRARGRYIALLDSDDLWLPDHLAKMVALIESDPTFDLVFPNAWFWGSPNFSGREFQSVFPARAPVTFEKVLKRECYIFGLVLFKRGLLDTVGGFDEELGASEDLDLWLRMLRHGCRFGFTREPLVKYRWRVDSLSNNSEQLLRNLGKVYQKWLNDPATTPAQRALIETQLCEAEALRNWSLYRAKLQARQFDEAAEHLALANAHYRRLKLTLVQWGLRIAPGLVAKLAAR
jgi:glycosyltransferase involved in cell wall biosynthesis